VDPVLIGILGIGVMLFLMVAGSPSPFPWGSWGSSARLSSWAGPRPCPDRAHLLGQGNRLRLRLHPAVCFHGQLTSRRGLRPIYTNFWRDGWAASGGIGCRFGLRLRRICAVTGSSVACVATMGTIIYPQMKKYGYDSQLATGVLSRRELWES